MVRTFSKLYELLFFVTIIAMVFLSQELSSRIFFQNKKIICRFFQNLDKYFWFSIVFIAFFLTMDIQQFVLEVCSNMFGKFCSVLIFKCFQQKH